MLDLELGIISQIEGDVYTILYFDAPTASLGQGQTFPLSQTYCDITYKVNDVNAIDRMCESPYRHHPCYQTFGWEAYIGTPLWVDMKRFGTLTFSSSRPQQEPFTQADKDFVQLMSQWVSTAFERQIDRDALAQARDEALAASQFKSQLMAKVSHELRTPLGSILGYTQFLKEGAYGPITTEQDEVTQKVIESTNYLAQVVNEFLDQAQLEKGKARLNLENFTPQDLIHQVEARMQILAESKGLALTVEIAPDFPKYLLGDRNKLEQILTNLVGNAVKFTKTGAVQVRLYQPGVGHWAIQVTDTGPGIPPEAQSIIFDPFGQVDGSVTRQHAGTGLGLSIVKQLTMLMKGEVTVESNVGQGSTFTAIFPLIPVQEETI